MKNKNLIAALGAGVLFLGVEVNAQNLVMNSEEEVKPVSGSFEGKVNTAAFVPTVIGGTQYMGQLILNFSQGSTQSIALTLPENISAGSYTFSDYTYSALYTAQSQAMYESASGTLTITKHDKAKKVIEGSFTFEAVPFAGMGAGECTVSATKFSVTYQEI